jgi:predicted PurR-regulated permease PerM
MVNVINYTDLIELFLALFLLLSFIFIIIFYYFFNKIKKENDQIKNIFFKNNKEILSNIDQLSAEIEEIDTKTQDLTSDFIKTLKILIENESENKKIFKSLSSEISNIKALETKNNKLLNIINRKTVEYQKHNKDEV